MGEGIFKGMPLSLSGVRRILEAMDWPDDLRPFLSFGEVGRATVESPAQAQPLGAAAGAEGEPPALGSAGDDGAGVYVILAPQNIVGSSILGDLEAMCLAAEARGRAVVLLNPLLT